MRTSRRLALGSAVLALGLVANAVLGPLVLDAIRYRTSRTTLNQVIGGDAATLLIVVPVALVAAVLLWRGHHAGPVVALAPAAFAVYMMPQLIVGQEYLELPGNNERFFPLELAVFVVAGLVLIGAWRTAAEAQPTVPGRLGRVAGWTILAVAVFLTLALHLPTLFDAWSDQPTRTEYLTTPTPFWLVKMMDLGIVVPIAVATGIGLLRSRPWADRLAFPMIGTYALLTTAVTSMAIAMQVRDDPDASIENVAVFAVFSLAFCALAVALYRPLFGSVERERGRRVPPPRSRSRVVL